MPYKNRADWNAYYRRRRNKAIEYLGGNCVRCGATEDLQFDHIDPSTKSFAVGERMTYAWERIQAELDKCQLLCRDCHVAKTSVEVMADHGSKARYEHHRCRCSECRAWKAEKTRRYRQRRKLQGVAA